MYIFIGSITFLVIDVLRFYIEANKIVPALICPSPFEVAFCLCQ